MSNRLERMAQAKYGLDEVDSGAKMYGSNSEKLQDILWQSLEKTVQQFVQKYGSRLNMKRQNELMLSMEDSLGDVSRQVIKAIDPSYDPDNLEDIGFDDEEESGYNAGHLQNMGR